MATSPLWSSYFESSFLFWVQLEFAHEEASRLGRLRRRSVEGFWLGSEGPLPVGVMFFPSLPFMGVMFFSFSFSFSLSLPLFLFSSPFLLLFLLSPILVRTLFLFFVFEGTACTVYFRDVRDDTANCNQLYLHWNKENFSFLAHEFVYPDVNNFLICSLAELFVFLLPRCPPASDSRGY